MPLDDAGSDAEEYESKQFKPSPPTRDRHIVPVEAALSAAMSKLSLQLHTRAVQQVSQLQRALLDINAAERRAESEASKRWAAEFASLAMTDAEHVAQKKKVSDQLMLSLRREHERQADETARHLAEIETAQRQAAEEKEKQKERAKTALAAEKAARDLKDASKVAQIIPDEAPLPPSVESPVAVLPQKGWIPSISPGAADFQKCCAARLAEAQEVVHAFVEDRAMRDVKRSIDKFVTLNVQQIAATIQQVRAKSSALAQFIARHPEPQQTYTLLTLSSKLLIQCEVQIARLHSFAFPLAEVAVAVMATHPRFADLLVARLHAACPLAVPCYYGFRTGGDEREYLRMMGYKSATDNGTVESTDDYLGRMTGYVMLYAAITQSDNPGNPHGLAYGWAYLARLLNALPPNRLTATAVDAFLKVAGFRMAGTYRGQFTKILETVQGDFLQRILADDDPDARAVATRLQTYLKTGRHTTAPDGRDMPQCDVSSSQRA